MELSTICRVCMQPVSLEYIDLDTPFIETTYFECFNYCTKLEAKVSDKFPKSLCLSCANLLQMSYDFIQAAVEADRLFNECFVQLEEDIKFEAADDNSSKEIIFVPSETALNENSLSSIKSTAFKELIDNNEINDVKESFASPEPLHYELLQEDIEQSNKKTEKKIDSKEVTEFIPNPKEVIQETKLEDVFGSHIESIEFEQVEEDAVQIAKEQVNRYEFIPLRSEIESNAEQGKILNRKVGEDYHFEKLDGFESEDEKPQTVDNQDVRSKVQCHICMKKIRKNYDDHMNLHTGNKPYNCNKCDESFATFKQFKLHKTQNHKKFWFCNKCGEVFESDAKLNTHQDNKHNTFGGLCLTCGYSFPVQDALEQHVKYEHWSRRFPLECTYCKKKYHLNTLPVHVKYAHSDVVQASKNKKFTCQYCFESFESSDVLEVHIQIHKGKHDYTCATCGEEFKGKRVFEEHKAKLHSVGNVNPNLRTCNKCEYTTTDMHSLIKHQKWHYNCNYERIPKYLCAYCPKKFFNMKPLIDHEDFRHGEQKTAHVCDVCDKKFYSNFKLKTHKKSAHGNQRPFLCKECPKAFKLKSQLLQHEKIHYNRKIDCPHCDKKFVQPCYLRVHLRTHTNELPFECHLCDKKFAIKVRLTYHLARHEGIVRKCEYCPETFDSMAKLRIHRFVHTGYPFVCDYCKENHHKRESFTRHMRRRHGIHMTEADVEENRLRNMENFYRNSQVEAEANVKS